jgi:hypothetical protein
MSKLILGLSCGVLFGLLSVGLMLPMKFTDKTSALLGAFINRFSIGFIIGAIVLPLPYWLIGLLIGLLLSVPDALITKAYTPIIGMGAAGGLLIGFVIGHFAS